MAVVDSVAEAHCALPAGAAAGTYRVGLVGGDSDAEAPADAATITLVDASQPPAVSAVAPAFASRQPAGAHRRRRRQLCAVAVARL